jgi:hypothetical protein
MESRAGEFGAVQYYAEIQGCIAFQVFEESAFGPEQTFWLARTISAFDPLRKYDWPQLTADIKTNADIAK